ncbi:nucleotidyltransferase domain-containing protein [Pseudonocardia lacus]|uniref:nucleotidyltransferase domain-containing protein n=1 Tax=Pseudonocardia lacus TaxID=2835865 RepID=UPI001BDD7C9E|nr:nucleotidyltransferase family protein [Pseudonocardia lacus]
MLVEEVVRLYRALDERGAAVRVDGGWCVDALLGRQSRPHADLDLAVDRADEPVLLAVLGEHGYRRTGRDGSAANYVLADDRGGRVDVHVYAFDASGALSFGIAYPPESLTGTGVLAGQAVRCIAPEWMLRFKTAYPPAAKDLADVRALCAAFGYAVPDTHRAPGPR